MRKCDFMKKKIIVFALLLSVFLLPIKANALELNFDNNFIQIGAKKKTTTKTTEDPSNL